MPGIKLVHGLFSPVALAVFAVSAALPCFSAGSDLSLVSRTEPEFPREAMQAGADKGLVRARLTVDATGEVVRVDILEANPRRVFDRIVVKTLSQWKYNPGSSGRNVEIDIEFKR